MHNIAKCLRSGCGRTKLQVSKWQTSVEQLDEPYVVEPFNETRVLLDETGYLNENDFPEMG